MDVLAPAVGRGPGGGNPGVVRSRRARCRLRLCQRGAQQPDGARHHGAACRSEARRYGLLLLVGERRGHLRTQPLHRGHAWGRLRGRGSHAHARLHRERRCLRPGRDGGGVRRHRPCTDDVGLHDLRDHPQLFHHRPADGGQPHQLFPFEPDAEEADLRGPDAPGRDPPACGSTGAGGGSPRQPGDAGARKGASGDRPGCRHPADASAR